MSKKYSEGALDYFTSGFNCCESTVLAGCDILSIENPLIPRIATCFGGGINGSGNMCGLYSGAMMVIGIKYGRDSRSESREAANQKAKQFHDFWLASFSLLNCRELLDIPYPEELEEPTHIKAYKVRHKCNPMCAKVVDWLAENL